MACRGLLSLLCATVWLVYAAARTSVHSRFTNGNPSAATEPSETWPRTECSLYRCAHDCMELALHSSAFDAAFGARPRGWTPL